jgi:hypothetical protein
MANRVVGRSDASVVARGHVLLAILIPTPTADTVVVGSPARIGHFVA